MLRFNTNLSFRISLLMANVLLSGCQQSENAKRIDVQSHVQAHLDQAWTLNTEGKREEALKEIEAALALDDQSALAYTRRGSLYRQQENYPAALKDLNKAITIDPSLYQAYGNRAAFWGQQGEYRKAIEDYSEGIQLASGNTLLYAMRADAYHRLHETELALKDFNAALKIDPDHLQSLNGRGVMLLQQQQFTQARADFQHMIELDPNDAGAYLNRGITYAEERRYELALADYQKALKIDPQKLEAHINLANVFADLGQYSNSYAEYQRVLEENPNYTNAIRFSAWFLSTAPNEKLRDGCKAIEMMAEVMSDSTNNDWYDFHVMATAQAEVGEFEEAVKLQKQAISLAPESNLENQEKFLEVFEAGRPIRHVSKPEK